MKQIKNNEKAIQNEKEKRKFISKVKYIIASIFPYLVVVIVKDLLSKGLARYRNTTYGNFWNSSVWR